MTRSDLARRLARTLRDVPDFPRPGIIFKDITPVLADAALFADATAAMATSARELGVTHVAGIESRGFILAAPIALELGAGFIPIRKPGKLPGPTHAVSYSLEYGEATLEMHQDAIAPGDRVLVVDDVLATGGTVNATKELVEASGGVVVAVSVLMDLSFLPGREALGDTPLHSLYTV